MKFNKKIGCPISIIFNELASFTLKPKQSTGKRYYGANVCKDFKAAFCGRAEL
jgi:hypothetical protein